MPLETEPLAFNPCPEVLFIDCEATGLHQPTHPVQIGIAWCDGTTQAYFVKPHESWQSWFWDPKAEAIHKITRDETERYGKDVLWLADWLNTKCTQGGLKVCSDNPEYEAYWIDILFRAADKKRMFPILNSYKLIGHLLKETPDPVEIFQDTNARVQQAFPVTHRADDDALHWAVIYRELVAYAQEQHKTVSDGESI